MNQENQKLSEVITKKIRDETFKNAEEIIRLRSKKPAHEAIVEMIRETVESLDNQSEPKLEIESIPIVLKVGIIAALLEVLKRMVIPEKHISEVFEAIYDIRAKCDTVYAEKLLPMKFFTILGMSQPSLNRSKNNKGGKTDWRGKGGRPQNTLRLHQGGGSQRSPRIQR